MNRISKRPHLSFAINSSLLLSIILVLSGCSDTSDLKTPKIAVNLPEKYNTPDGMVLDSDNNILLCCPNYNDDSYPAKLLKITPDAVPYQ